MVNNATLSPGTSIAAYNTADFSVHNGAVLEWEYDDTPADKVEPAMISLPTSGTTAVINIVTLGSVVNGIRTLFEFTGSAPSQAMLNYLECDVSQAQGVTSASASVRGNNVLVTFISEPGLVVAAVRRKGRAEKAKKLT